MPHGDCWGHQKPGVFSLYSAEDMPSKGHVMELSANTLSLLESFDVDPVRGFLPSKDPLLRLPQQELQPWEDLVNAIPELLVAGQASKVLDDLTVLPVGLLQNKEERMRALLLLSVLAHAYVWGRVDKPHDTIPQGVAVPLHALAKGEGMPPVLTHLSIVLSNWRRLDPMGPLSVENLACNCLFLGGQDEAWFYMVTVEIEARGGGMCGALLQAQELISQATEATQSSDIEGIEGASRAGAGSGPGRWSTNTGTTTVAIAGVTKALVVVKESVFGMTESLLKMPSRCHPLIFYERVRPFLSGWKDNPTLPQGVVYEGVSPDPQQYHGGSAAQSTIFPALDAALGVNHDRHASNRFLIKMREYMPQNHRRILEHFSDPSCPSIRDFVASIGVRDNVHVTLGYDQEEALHLKDAYNDCLQAVHKFRSTHLGIVGSYILQQQKNQRQKEYSQGKAASGKGTGGTPLVEFLKPLRDDARDAIL